MINLLFIIASLAIFIIFYKYPALIGKRLKLLDKNATPLIGGIFLFFGLSINYLYIYFYESSLLENFINFNFISLIFIIALLDDRFNLTPNIRLIACTLIIIFFVYQDNLYIETLKSEFFGFLYFPENFLIKFLFPTFCIFVLIQAYNFTDGINGLANLIGLSWFLYIIIKSPIFFSTYFILGYFLIFFLILNFKNKSYLGDSGNYIISTIIAVFLVKINALNPYDYFAEEILLLLLIPGLDLIRLFIKRISIKKSPFDGDLDHFHHHLINKFGLKKCNFIYLFLMNLPIYIYYFYEKFLIPLIIITIIIYILLILKYGKKNI